MKKLQVVNTSCSVLDSELLERWLVRYFPALDTMAKEVRHHLYPRLKASLMQATRLETQQKLLGTLPNDCAQAASDMQKFLSATNLELNIWESRDLTIHIYHIYDRLLQSYASNYIFSPLLDHIDDLDSPDVQDQAAHEILPSFSQLAWTIEPLLGELKKLYRFATRAQATHVIVTQLYFTRCNILKYLSPYERIWLMPYLKMVEDLVCISWQRVGAASVRQVDPQLLNLVKNALPKHREITDNVCQNLKSTCLNQADLPLLQSDQVVSSIARDVGMFQSYLWMWILESNAEIVRRDFLSLCKTICSFTGLEWTVIRNGVYAAHDTIVSYLTEAEQMLLQPHTDSLGELLLDAPVEQHSNHLSDFSLYRLGA